MQNTKLIELLEGLTTRERSRFEEYVHSPFFNKNKKVQKLCEYILSYAPNFYQKALDKKVIFPLLFGAKPYNEIKINNIVSDLLQLLYDFLAIKQYQQKEQLQKTFLLDELLDRGAHDHVKRIARRFRQLQDKAPYRNFEYYEHESALHDKLDHYYVSRSIHTYDENLQLKNDNLDLFYFGKKLLLACDMTSRNIVSKAGYKCHLIEDLIRYYEQNHQNFQDHPSLSIYYKTLQMLQNSEEEKYYYELKKLLEEHFQLFPQQELRVIYVYVQNYCIKKINSGQTIYYKELQSIYKILLEQKIIFMNGYLTQWAYGNIITVGIRLQDFSWTEDVIHQYKDYLVPEERSNAVAYNLAAFYYAKKDYKAAAQELHNVEFADKFYHLGAKIIQLKSFYELDESEPFYALVEASKKYILRNKKLADYHKKANANFFTMSKKIYELKMNRPFLSKSAFNQKQKNLKEKLSNLDPVTNKEWLEDIFKKL